jgi:hypothetical protein
LADHETLRLERHAEEGLETLAHGPHGQRGQVRADEESLDSAAQLAIGRRCPR